MPSKRSAAKLLLGILFAVGAGLIWWHHVLLHDIYSASQYQPTAEVRTIVDRLTLTGGGTRILYATHPEVNDATQFNQQCSNFEKSSVVLGCYSGDRIYLYLVDEKELDGVTDVSAAHEMLHAAYHRLSVFERPEVEKLLTAQAAQLERDDATFVQRMKVYDGLSDAERLDELHSIIGTEVASISPELEAYYGRYFESRSQVVALYERYSGVFLALQEQSTQLAKSIDMQAAQLRQQVEAYNVTARVLSQDVEDFNAKARNGGFTSQVAFDHERSQLVGRAATLQAERTSIEAAQAAYEEAIEQYNSIATHISQLNKSLDSKLAPAPAI